MIRCPRCGAENPNNAKYCSLCRSPLISAEQGVQHQAPGEIGAGDRDTGVSETIKRAGSGSPAEEYQAPGDWTALGETAIAKREVELWQVTPFSWRRMLRISIIAAFLTWVVTLLVEGVAAYITGESVARGGITAAKIILLILLGGLVFGCGYWAGYRNKRKGFLTGLVAVIFYLFVFRVLEGLFVTYLLVETVNFPNPINIYFLVPAIVFYLPLGMMGGWLGEKRVASKHL